MKIVYRKVSGRVVSKRASDSHADALIAKGWSDEHPKPPKAKKRGRPRKVKVEEKADAVETGIKPEDNL